MKGRLWANLGGRGKRLYLDSTTKQRNPVIGTPGGLFTEVQLVRVEMGGPICQVSITQSTREFRITEAMINCRHR